MEHAGSELSAYAAEIATVAGHGAFPAFDPAQGETVMSPAGSGAGHWVGAPSVCADAGSGRVLLAYRRRRPRDGSLRERGYLAAIAESHDGGRSFEDIWQMTKEEVGTSSIERLCLRRGTAEELRLYTSWEDPPSSGRWRIDLMLAEEPEAFSVADARPVVLPADAGVDAVKDPYLVLHAGRWNMYVSTFLTPDGPAPTSLATSDDGHSFRWQGETLPVGAAGTWDAYQARITCVVRHGRGYVAYYDGAASPADDTEEHAGLACSLDLRTWRRVTGEDPALVSPHATGSLRYIDVAEIGDARWAYYEYARPDGSHEVRRSRLDTA